MIILEGADNSGKSTLAEQISEHLDLDVWHAGGPGYSTHRLRREMAQHTRLQVCDRSNFISGPVYEQSLGSKAHYDKSVCQGYIKHLLHHELAVVVYCTGQGPETFRPDEDLEYVTQVHYQNEVIRDTYHAFFRPLLHYKN